MRLSSMKAAHVGVNGETYRKSGYLTQFLVGNVGNEADLDHSVVDRNSEFRGKTRQLSASPQQNLGDPGFAEEYVSQILFWDYGT
jgi:hypothetical protein